jgi:hypothetical protein
LKNWSKNWNPPVSLASLYLDPSKLIKPAASGWGPSLTHWGIPTSSSSLIVQAAAGPYRGTGTASLIKPWEGLADQGTPSSPAASSAQVNSSRFGIQQQPSVVRPADSRTTIFEPASRAALSRRTRDILQSTKSRRESTWPKWMRPSLPTEGTSYDHALTSNSAPRQLRANADVAGNQKDLPPSGREWSYTKYQESDVAEHSSHSRG